jgi:hypothetical protein
MAAGLFGVSLRRFAGANDANAGAKNSNSPVRCVYRVSFGHVLKNSGRGTQEKLQQKRRESLRILFFWRVAAGIGQARRRQPVAEKRGVFRFKPRRGRAASPGRVAATSAASVAGWGRAAPEAPGVAKGSIWKKKCEIPSSKKKKKKKKTSKLFDNSGHHRVPRHASHRNKPGVFSNSFCQALVGFVVGLPV